ncbi:MAG: hypothetical protein AB3N20_13615 [Rhizobiaceae bacterium]
MSRLTALRSSNIQSRNVLCGWLSSEVAERLHWGREAATRADREGDHRRARMLRIDAPRARQLAEDEQDLRPSLPGYGIAPWT